MNADDFECSICLGKEKNDISRGGNAEKWTFDWIIAPPKYGGEIV